MKYTKIKDYFIDFIISRFAPDYEKLKTENKELKQDIYNLIRKGNEAEGLTVKLRWKLALDTEDMIFIGNGTNTDNKFQGLLSQIEDQ